MSHSYKFMILLIIIATYSPAQYPDDFSFVKVPDPLSDENPVYSLINRAIPDIGESFFDQSFGTKITRVTEANSIHGRHEYSRFDPFNIDKSLILLDPDTRWNIYRTNSFPYNQSGNLIRTINLEEPRWDPIDTNVLWGLDEFSIKQLNVSTGQTTVVKDFSQDPLIGPLINQGNTYRITTMEEGESSIDKRYWALILQGNEQVDYNPLYLLTWDRTTDTIVGLYQIPVQESLIDWVGMSPLGKWVLIGGDYDNGGKLAGLDMANKELTMFHRLDYSTAHSDVGLDTDGNEVIVMQNIRTDYIDLLPIDTQTQPILETGGSYENTNRIPLVRLFYSDESSHGLHSGFHISCNVPGYCLLSTFIEPGLPEQNWLDRTIIIIKLDRQNPQAYYLAKVYNTSGSYWEETHATISTDGSKIVWASNWGQNVGTEQVFVLQLDMPSNWRELLTTIKNPQGKIPEGFRLDQNYPNPFNSGTFINYTLSTDCLVELRIYNTLGQHIKTLLSHNQPAGSYKINWNAKDDEGDHIPGGLYICRMKTDGLIQTRKLLYLK
ncbi:T9SS type A sorting domain-containing protein [candidate division KSB1 bacterium]|nr:T9SS type A sorting domain-containing protein [candidate division KSB1 bacterium]